MGHLAKFLNALECIPVAAARVDPCLERVPGKQIHGVTSAQLGIKITNKAAIPHLKAYRGVQMEVLIMRRSEGFCLMVGGGITGRPYSFRHVKDCIQNKSMSNL